jgi:hypothetical protein
LFTLKFEGVLEKIFQMKVTADFLKSKWKYAG